MNTVEIIILIALFGIFFIASGVVTGVLLYYQRWNYKFEITENINGTVVRTKKGRCRLVAFGDGGEEIFYLKKPKKWRVAYGKRIGKNTIGWHIGEDGYWYNYSYGNFDKRMRELGVNPVDRDMRYAYASARKGLENRYDKKNFMEKYGTVIAFGMLFLCIIAMGAFLWVGFNGQQKVASINAQSMTTAKEVMEASKSLISSLANLKLNSGGSGYTTA